MNHNHTIAIHPTTGTDGTGQIDGVPCNHSIKGPWSQRASQESALAVRFDLIEFDDLPVEFLWFFTRRDDEGLWAELFAPVIEEGGFAAGWTERVLIGKIGGDLDPTRASSPLPAPAPAPDISVARRPA